MRAPAEQAALVRQSIARFRRAIRLRPDFDRACYNLGTVFYAFACAQQSSVTQRLPSRVTQVPQKPEDHVLFENTFTSLQLTTHWRLWWRWGAALYSFVHACQTE